MERLLVLSLHGHTGGPCPGHIQVHSTFTHGVCPVSVQSCPPLLTFYYFEMLEASGP